METVDIILFSLNANGPGDDIKRHVFTKLKNKGDGILYKKQTAVKQIS